MRLFSLALVLVLPVAAVAQLPYSNPELGFAMRLPEGFYPQGQDLLASPKVLACFVKPGDGGGTGWARLCAERMDGTLPRDRLSTDELPAGARDMTFTWKGWDLQGVSVQEEMDGQPVTTMLTLVPLRKSAVRLVITGPRANAAETQAMLVSTLASLQGESSWLSRSARAEKAGESVGMFGVILIALGTGMWIAKRKKANS